MGTQRPPTKHKNIRLFLGPPRWLVDQVYLSAPLGLGPKRMWFQWRRKASSQPPGWHPSPCLLRGVSFSEKGLPCHSQLVSVAFQAMESPIVAVSSKVSWPLHIFTDTRPTSRQRASPRPQGEGICPSAAPLGPLGPASHRVPPLRAKLWPGHTWAAPQGQPGRPGSDGFCWEVFLRLSFPAASTPRRRGSCPFNARKYQDRDASEPRAAWPLWP